MGIEAQIQELKNDRARFLAFAFARAELLIEIDLTGKITFVSGASQHLVALPPKSLINHSFASLLAPGSDKIFQMILDAAVSGGWIRETTVKLRRNNELVRANFAACPLPTDTQRYFITLSQSLVPEAESAKLDVDTGLLDATSFTKLARQMLTSEDGTEMKMTMVEVDGLDDLVRRVEASGGGNVMQDIGRLLENLAGGNPASRLSNSKFGVLHDASLDASKIETKIADFARAKDPTGAGVEVKTSDIQLDTKGLSEADVGRALAYAVSSFVDSSPGTFTMASLSEGLQSKLNETVAKVAEFRNTLAADGYELVFQPIVDLNGRHIHHQEALSRLPDGSSPFAMVTFAEQLGFITEFDLMVLRKAIRYLFDFPDAHDIAINVSGRSLGNPQFVDEFISVIRQHGGLCRRLLIEITESSQISEFNVINKIVKTLRGLGNKVCIDDFGSGAAAFHYLRELDVDVVKIDGSYIKDLERSERDRAFVGSIIGLCNELQLETVGEYVETNGQIDILTRMGLNHGQGYLFGKPNKAIYQKKPTKPVVVPPVQAAAPLPKSSGPSRWV